MLMPKSSLRMACFFLGTSFAIYLFASPLQSFITYYSSSESDQKLFDEMDRIECAVLAMEKRVDRDSTRKARDELELDIDFVLEKLDSLEGGEQLKLRRKRLVRRVILLSNRLKTLRESCS